MIDAIFFAIGASLHRQQYPIDGGFVGFAETCHFRVGDFFAHGGSFEAERSAWFSGDFAGSGADGFEECLEDVGAAVGGSARFDVEEVG